ncbi:hypothetical protein [Cyclobacterium amurskyense]|uniref:Uncharacterized protein n=1 Tax=Cyclobacterium amurskyense TaxID=320787 RepID=A0A0H4P9W8_9BACT|nr:hypothetical protein [Cyclobacterium amurskyense]AKP50964.1 hypothetical protein CA2015_1527 [Cyclobacterium amurskyense]|tara:strand:- start:17553 stop:18485 length:933 start_codon:yes stop_codon:yes gene_type:complete
MKRFIKNSLYFVIPFVLYSCLIALIDPFNYLNGFGVTSEEKKKAIALDIEPHLYKMIDFKNNPKKNWVLGDSRSNGLYIAMDSSAWSNLAYGGASLKEVIQSFWWAREIEKPDTVLIGINLNLYNKFNRRFWVEETINRKSNFFTYAFNKYTFNATFAIMAINNQGEEESESQVELPGAKEQFWKKKLNGTDKFYKNITYPDEYHKQLKEIADHCKKEGIKLIFWIPPLHKDYHEVLTKYELEEFEAKFKHDLFSLGDVFDFNYSSNLTLDENNFRDPVHFNARVAKLIEEEIRSYSPHHSTLYKKKLLD